MILCIASWCKILCFGLICVQIQDMQYSGDTYCPRKFIILSHNRGFPYKKSWDYAGHAYTYGQFSILNMYTNSSGY